MKFRPSCLTCGCCGTSHVTRHTSYAYACTRACATNVVCQKLFSYFNDRERLMTGLLLRFMFDQRVALVFFGFHSWSGAGPPSLFPSPSLPPPSPLCLSPSTPFFISIALSCAASGIMIDETIDEFVDEIDAIPATNFWFWFLFSPSWLFQRIFSAIDNESYIDEFLAILFSVLSFVEILRTVSLFFSLYFYNQQHRKPVDIQSIVMTSMRQPLFSFASVALLSMLSYGVGCDCMCCTLHCVILCCRCFGTACFPTSCCRS